ncbi:MAG: CDP-diacylglycerol--glycerol-3-phosphate 3-phosphatidyltransferase [Candidatus Marinimicrobia bacterium]|nr:CDP-diacylglycerol--glycerol-3-phosphate 3-phosphatidyltransferase [Candidatus Neomarinimicrobiota bacterium]
MKRALIPNIITLFRIILTPLFLFFLLVDKPYYMLFALIVFIVASVSDGVDGHVARKYGFVSEFGKFVDPLADKILIISTFIALIFLDIIPCWMVFIVIFRDIAVTVIRMIMIKRGDSVVTSNIAKSKTVFQIVFIYIVISFKMILQLPFMNFMHPAINFLESNNFYWILMLITTIFTLYTGVLYLLNNKVIFKKSK